MIVLPVLDLRAGVVVHARGGRREHYLPLDSSLGLNSSPLAQVAELLRRYSFRQLYLADLDAIEGKGDNSSVVGAIARCCPDLELWVDAGTASRQKIEHLLELGVSRPVVGTETLSTIEIWRRLQEMPWAERLVLSMDFRGAQFLGPPGLERRPALWSATIIAMSLSRVGSKAGPDWTLLEQLRRARPQAGELLAAGGIRGVEDLTRLAAWGAGGALLASVLYEGRLKPAELQQLP